MKWDEQNKLKTSAETAKLRQVDTALGLAKIDSKIGDSMIFKAIRNGMGLDQKVQADFKRKYELLMILAGVIYSAWMFAFGMHFMPLYASEIKMTPRLEELLWFGEFLSPLLCFGLFVFCRYTSAGRQNLYLAYQLLCYLITAHYFFMIWEAKGHDLFIMGSFVLSFSVLNMLVTPTTAAAYVAFMSLCSGVLFFGPIATVATEFFVMGQLTVGLFAFISIFEKTNIDKRNTKLFLSLQSSEDLIRLSVDATGIATWQYDFKSDLVTGSPQYFEHVGLPENTRTISNQKIINQFVHPEDRQMLHDCFEKIFETGVGETIEYRMITIKGEVRWFSSRGHVFGQNQGEIQGILGTTMDITEQKKVQFAERQARESLEMALESGNMGAFDLDLKTNMVTASESLLEIFGEKNLVFSSTNTINKIFAEDRLEREAKLAAAIQKEQSEFKISYRINHPEKGICWIKTSAKIFYNPKTKVAVRIVGICEDVTEEVERLENVRQQNEIFNMTLKAANLAHWTWNPKLNDLKFDAEWFRQIDVLGDDARIETWMSATHPDDMARVRSSISDHLAGKTEVYECMMRLKARSGGYKHVLAKGKIVERDAEGLATRFAGVHVDLTEMMTLRAQIEEQQQQLINAAQLSALGEMASGIGHEIYNPIASIKLRAQSVARSISKGRVPENISNTMEIISADVDRVSEIIAGMKLLSRDPSKLTPDSFDIVDIVTQTMSLSKMKMSEKGIVFEMIGNESAIMIKGFSTMMSQVVINLVNNAIFAVDEMQDIKDRWITITFEKEEGKCLVRVADGGKVIPKSVRDKIFQPFFTTKPVGKGTGLGLSISRSILEKHGGNLWIAPEEVPTEFIFSLPIAE